MVNARERDTDVVDARSKANAARLEVLQPRGLVTRYAATALTQQCMTVSLSVVQLSLRPLALSPPNQKSVRCEHDG